jgi:cell division protein FtsB
MSATTTTEESTTFSRVESLRNRLSSVRSHELTTSARSSHLLVSSKGSRSSSQEREVSQLKQENQSLKLENLELKKKNSKLANQNSRLAKENEANNVDTMVISLETIEGCNIERKKLEDYINAIDQRKVLLYFFLLFASLLVDQVTIATNRARDDLFLCILCLDLQKNILFSPCNHICICEKCSKEDETPTRSKKLKKCPNCDQSITARTKIFL